MMSNDGEGKRSMQYPLMVVFSLSAIVLFYFVKPKSDIVCVFVCACMRLCVGGKKVSL